MNFLMKSFSSQNNLNNSNLFGRERERVHGKNRKHKNAINFQLKKKLINQSINQLFTNLSIKWKNHVHASANC